MFLERNSEINTFFVNFFKTKFQLQYKLGHVKLLIGKVFCDLYRFVIFFSKQKASCFTFD